MNPKVSICMATYNHQKFIGQAIESVLMQRVNFKIELVIGEDFSTDKTKEIITKYQKNYPKIIKTIVNNTNFGVIRNFINILSKCKGKYIAMLEGDDYWTDPYKLKKQVDFLEKNKDFSICFHRIKILKNKNLILSQDYKQNIFSINDILKINFIPTCSVLYRNILIKKFPKWYYRSWCGDWFLHIFNTQYGKIFYLKKAMAVYRIHDEGICSMGGKVNLDESVNRLLNLTNSFKKLSRTEEYLNKDQKLIIKKRVSQFYFEIVDQYRFKRNIFKIHYYIFLSFIDSPFYSFNHFILEKNYLGILIYIFPNLYMTFCKLRNTLIIPSK